MTLEAALAGWVDICRRRAWAVTALFALLTVAMGLYTQRHLGIDANTSNIMSPDLPWRQNEARLDAAFPDNVDLIVIVIDAITPDLAEDAADRLAARLTERLAEPNGPFRAVRRPDGGAFFRSHGLLLLPLDEVRDIVERTIEAQPLLATLAADPSLVGLFGVLAQALDGIGRGEVAADRFDRPLEAVAQSIEAVLAGRHQPLSWQGLLSGRTPGALELRRFVLVQPRLDYSALQPGAVATAAVRAAAAELGLTAEASIRVRLTGPVSLADEEFATLAEGTGWATFFSLALVCLLLVLALRSARLIVAIVLTLLAGFVATSAFATAAVGALNLISVAFAAIFFGIAVDFGIQFTMRYRQERHKHDDLPTALARTGGNLGRPLILAAATTAAGFLSFTPTDYAGVSELGLIAGFGMFVALAFNFTLLPALLALLRPAGEAAPVGLVWAAPLDRLIVVHHWPLLGAAALAAALGAGAMGRLTFDADPLNLKDRGAESVMTLYELADLPETTPYVISVLAPDLDRARALASRLEALPEARQVLTLASFLPGDLAAKFELLEDLVVLLGPALEARRPAQTHDLNRLRSAIASVTAQLRQPHAATPPARRLAAALGATEAALAGDSNLAARLSRALLAALPAQLDALGAMLAAGPVGIDELPPELRRHWVAADGSARIDVYPRDDLRDPAALARFVAAVRAVAPEATGPPVTILESGKTVVRAFTQAGLWAFAAVTLLLIAVVRRPVDVALILAPLAWAGLVTVAASVMLRLPVTYANIITLPLMLGIGVGYGIYVVANWRAGENRPLQSSTARAVLFSALTTMAAFGSLALSSHPGTADMGKLLALALATTLLGVLVVLPALLATVRR